MEVDMEGLARKYIKDYQTSKVKLNLPNKKFFLKVNSEEDKEVINNCQESLATVLKYNRVNKRNARAKAVWLPEKSLALVTKVVKSLLKSFGYQDKSGIYLYPEEMLFLLETNKLEVQNSNNIPISIEEAHNLFENCENCNLNKYRTFKKLALLGYKLLRQEEIQKRLEKVLQNKRKRTIETEDTNDNKKIKTNVIIAPNQDMPGPESSMPCQTNESGSTSESDRTNEYIANIFSELRKDAPKESVLTEIKKPPDFFVFLPFNNHRTNYDLKLYICNEDILTTKNFVSNAQNVIYAICLKDDISFYKFSTLHLPSL